MVAQVVLIGRALAQEQGHNLATQNGSIGKKNEQIKKPAQRLTNGRGQVQAEGAATLPVTDTPNGRGRPSGTKGKEIPK